MAQIRPTTRRASKARTLPAGQPKVCRSGAGTGGETGAILIDGLLIAATFATLGIHVTRRRDRSALDTRPGPGSHTLPLLRTSAAKIASPKPDWWFAFLTPRRRRSENG